MEDHQKERPAGGQWAQQQKAGLKQQSQERQTQGSGPDGQQGDPRSPDQPIGEVAYEAQFGQKENRRILMGIPSENKNQVIRTREEDDPAAFSVKPVLDERKTGLRGADKRQGDLRNETAKEKPIQR